MFDSDYFYSSAPSDVSSDITINIATEHEEEGYQSPIRGPSLDYWTQQEGDSPGQSSERASLSDRITRKLFRKKGKEMLGGKNDRWGRITIGFEMFLALMSSDPVNICSIWKYQQQRRTFLLHGLLLVPKFCWEIVCKKDAVNLWNLPQDGVLHEQGWVGN